jgi:hypothetical protein
MSEERAPYDADKLPAPVKWIKDLLEGHQPDLNDDIALTLAKHYPATAEAIRHAYDALKSWDAVISLCEFTAVYGYTDPWESLPIFLESAEGRPFRDRYELLLLPSDENESD